MLVIFVVRSYFHLFSDSNRCRQRNQCWREVATRTRKRQRWQTQSRSTLQPSIDPDSTPTYDTVVHRQGAILAEKPNVRWSDVAGLENAKEALREAVRTLRCFRGSSSALASPPSQARGREEGAMPPASPDLSMCPPLSSFPPFRIRPRPPKLPLRPAPGSLDEAHRTARSLPRPGPA